MFFDVQFTRQFLKLTKQWAFSRNREICIGILAEKSLENAQSNWQAFLFDQPTRLHKAPRTIFWEAPGMKRKFVQRNPGSLDLDFLFLTAEMNNCAPQRFGANQNQPYCVEHLPGCFAISGLVHINCHVGAMKGDDGRFVP